MKGIERLIVGSEKLTEIFGGWPTFHDSEVIDLHLWRGDVDPSREQYAFPILTIKIHLMVEAPSSRETVAVLRFKDVFEIKLQGFNHQNALFGIEIEERSGVKPGAEVPPDFFVTFQEAFGLSASFRCQGIEVVETTRVS